MTRTPTLAVCAFVFLAAAGVQSVHADDAGPLLAVADHTPIKVAATRRLPRSTQPARRRTAQKRPQTSRAPQHSH